MRGGGGGGGGGGGVTLRKAETIHKTAATTTTTTNCETSSSFQRPHILIVTNMLSFFPWTITWNLLANDIVDIEDRETFMSSVQGHFTNLEE